MPPCNSICKGLQMFDNDGYRDPFQPHPTHQANTGGVFDAFEPSRQKLDGLDD